MSTRRGKIARLPENIRVELNTRLKNGETMAELVEWLNGLEEVRVSLLTYFDGMPIREQNVSEWKRGGFVDWEHETEAQRALRTMHENAKGLSEAVQGNPISDRFAMLLSAKMTGLAELLLNKEADPEKQWARLCEVQKVLSRFRRDDHRGVRVMIKREQWAQASEQLQREYNDGEESPTKWLTLEERNAKIKVVYGTATQEDMELLERCKNKWLTPAKKAKIIRQTLGIDFEAEEGVEEEYYEEEEEEFEEGVCGGDGEGV